MITIVAHMTVPEHNVDAILAAAPGFIQKTRSEPGCVEFWLHRQIDDPAQFVWYENFRDQEAVDAHVQSAHVRTWFALVDRTEATNTYHLYTRVTQ